MTGNLTIGDGPISVTVAAADGGRLAQITAGDVDLLVGRDEQPEASSAMGWGCYPMVPWAGRIRDGVFEFGGRRYELPRSMGAHAIHGVGLISSWDRGATNDRSVELTLELPTDARWPFGGTARQRISVDGNQVRLELSVTAHDRPFPASLGWHPWFRKPSRLDFHPTAMYRRDHHQVAVDELVDVPPGPWDDCFVNDRPVSIDVGGVRVELTSDCTHWVVFDEKPHATCIEPQTGPPDAFNIAPQVVEPGQTQQAWYELTIA
jgi:aldose 1-epimerase